MTKSKKVVAVVGAGLLVLLGYTSLSIKDRGTDRKIEVPVLQPGERVKVIINPRNHTATTVTKTGTTTKYVNNRITSVLVDDNGTVRVVSRKWGTSLDPIIGGLIERRPKLYVGLSVFYYDRLSILCGLAGTGNNGLLGIISLSYNFWRNTDVFIGADQHNNLHVGVGVRF